MILSEYVRVLDISWEEFLWSSLWAVVIIIVINAAVIITTWDLARKSFVKNQLPQLHANKVGKLLEENDSLKAELKETIKERNEFKDRLVTISLSAEVKGE